MTHDTAVFADRFKKLRIKSGYTQQQIANLFNVTRPCICYWENGKRVPDFIKLSEICRFFGVSSDYLLNITYDPTPKIKDRDVPYQKQEAKLDLSKLTEDSIKKLTEFYDYLIYKQNEDRKK